MPHSHPSSLSRSADLSVRAVASTAHLLQLTSFPRINDYSSRKQREQLFEQITNAVTILANASSNGSIQQPLMRRLQKHARAAEDGIHQLRRLQLERSAFRCELSQTLTVLVLVADMLADGLIDEADMAETSSLMHRNASRALSYLNDLRAETLGAI